MGEEADSHLNTTSLQVVVESDKITPKQPSNNPLLNHVPEHNIQMVFKHFYIYRLLKYSLYILLPMLTLAPCSIKQL